MHEQPLDQRRANVYHSPAMRIAEIHVENFRGVQSATLSCGSLTALVGRNGAGKSTFLHALDLFYKPNATVTVEDFSHRKTDAPIAIRVTFENLQPDEEAAFQAYVHGGTLTVTKRFAAAGQGGNTSGQYFAARRVYGRFSSARAQDGRKKTNEVIELAKALRDEGLVSDVPVIRSGTDADRFMWTFESEHPDLLELQDDAYQFFGEKNVGGGKLDNFTQYIYVPAVRDAQQETGGRGASFSELLELVVMRRVNALPQVVGLREQLRKIVTDIFEPEQVRGHLSILESGINAVLKPFVPSASLSLNWGGEPTVSFETPKVVPALIEDAFSGDISRKGHGLQRALVFALLAHLARIRTARAEGPDAAGPADGNVGAAAAEKAPARRGPDYILGIEEPELYQHPNRCRHFASVLRELSSGPAEDGSMTQILFTAHSPYFVSLEHFDEVRLVRKDGRGPTGLPSTSLSSHSVEGLRSAWALACGLKSEEISAGSLLARLRRTMTDLVNEGFFADVVVLVEGVGDVGVLSAVAAHRNADWVARGVTVLAVDGKANLGAPILVFRALGIPTFFVFDADRQLQGKGKPENQRQAKAANGTLLRLGGADVDESFDGFPEETVADRFACFAYSLEDACRDAVGKELYDEIAGRVADELGWKVEDVLKSGRGGECFVREIYAAGKSLPTLERIVDQISAFADSRGPEESLPPNPSANTGPVASADANLLQ